MRCWPLIVRELREQARRPQNFWARALGATGLLAGSLYLAWSVVSVSGGVRVAGMSMGIASALARFESMSGALFGAMNLVLVVGIWFVAPLLTADCLSRERREGTLGLLFLTPLKPADIVLAKLVAHGLRALTVLLAALPVLMVPIVGGGVSWMDALRAVLLDAGALLLALTAGLRASTTWEGSRAVLFGALLLSLTSAVVWVVAWPVLTTIWGFAGNWMDLPEAILDAALNTVFRLMAQAFAVMRYPTTMWMLPGSRPVAGAGDLLLPGVMLTIAILLAAWVVRAATHSVARAQTVGRRARFGTAAGEFVARPRLFLPTLARLRALILDRLPILWIEIRSWRLRLAPWIVLLAIAILEVEWSGIRMAQPDLGFHVPKAFLVGIAAITSASALQREKHTGVLELLLTTPRGALGVVGGKYVGQALLFALPILLIAALDYWTDQVGAIAGIGLSEVSAVDFLQNTLQFMVRIAMVVSIGLFFSWRRESFVTALLWTLVILGVLALVIDGITRMVVLSPHVIARALAWRTQSLVPLILEAALALAFLLRLHRGLSHGRSGAR